ncbi:MAG TPA: hypothetical protein VIL46_11810, partial [Gemmataceae bacterium]
MAKIRIGARALATLLLWGGAGSAYAAPTVAQMLQFVPRQPGVEVTTPAEAEQSACRVELIKGVKNAQGKTPSGWL